MTVNPFNERNHTDPRYWARQANLSAARSCMRATPLKPGTLGKRTQGHLQVAATFEHSFILQEVGR